MKIGNKISEIYVTKTVFTNQIILDKFLLKPNCKINFFLLLKMFFFTFSFYLQTDTFGQQSLLVCKIFKQVIQFHHYLALRRVCND